MAKVDHGATSRQLDKLGLPLIAGEKHRQVKRLFAGHYTALLDAGEGRQ
jgi:hypothetical protein